MFDARAAENVERTYQTQDVVAQRAAVLEALALQAGERVLDVGCGPGFLMRSMAEAGAAVVGIDPSESMRALAARRCSGLPNVQLLEADALHLPGDGGAFDAVVATQVYEYVDDMPGALAEARRVLKSSGRLVVLDTDWDSIVWASSDRERTDRVLSAWDQHLVDPHLPRHLPRLLREAGFALERCSVVPLLNPSFEPETYSAHMIRTIARFAAAHGLQRAETDAWEADLHALAARGEYFFSLNRYLFVARPAR